MSLRILHLEDNPRDAELVKASLAAEALSFEIVVVSERDEFLRNLDRGGFHLILSDFAMPAFDGHTALAIAQNKCPTVPFIFISGTIGEERATEALKSGATDYVLKDRLSRLGSAVRRALRECEERDERIRMLDRIRKSEERFQLVAQATLDTLWEWDVASDALWWSESITKMFGYVLNEAGHDFDWWAERVHPDDRVRTLTGFKDALSARKQFWSAEYRFRRADGSYADVLNRCYLVYANDGKPERAIGSLMDITERKRAEAIIREQAALLDVAQDAILVCNLENRVLFWNKGAERLYGWSAEETVGQIICELIQKTGSVEFEDARAGILVKGEWTGEFRQVAKDGKDLIVESRWTLVRDEYGNPKSILIINTDTTGKKQLEMQFLRAQRLESLGTLASGIAHDLNNVLAPILMATQLLQLKGIDEEGQTWLEGMAANTKRGVEMVRQVLTFTRGAEGDRGALQIKHLTTDLERILKDTFPRSIQIRCKSPKTLWTIVGNSTKLYQVLLNLCVNARDAMPKGGTLGVELENMIIDEQFARTHGDAHPGRYVVITVSDTGTGIPSHLRDKIFDPFFTTKEMGKGTGLGLSTVVGIVKSHSGFLTVTSEVGKGTQFRVFLPAEETVDAKPHEDKHSVLPLGHGEIVLVVDDEDAILQMTRATLVRHGYRVLTAKDGTEAVALYAQHREGIRAILTDMAMPFMDGAAVVRALRKLNSRLGIVVMTGLCDNENMAQLEGYGDIQYLQKPYSMEKLLAALDIVVKEATAAGR